MYFYKSIPLHLAWNPSELTSHCATNLTNIRLVVDIVVSGMVLPVTTLNRGEFSSAPLWIWKKNVLKLKNKYQVQNTFGISCVFSLLLISRVALLHVLYIANQYTMYRHFILLDLEIHAFVYYINRYCLMNIKCNV